ncbi:hypothetical protein EYV94_16320 [Puteibacter caeruleilacunae]|nr:hypothetical protein EYV94_16320 [Puteibacter caeruleilacunae]
MKKYILLFIQLAVFCGFMACEDMNELHDPYLSQGETDYVGRVDSVKSYGGNGRIKFEYWVTDPRVSKLHIKWSESEERIVTVNVPPHEASDTLEVIVGDDVPVAENSHSFIMTTESDLGVKSVDFEQLGNVYGPKYISTLLNRRINSVEMNDGNLSLDFAGSLNSTEVGVEIFWTSLTDGDMSAKYTLEELASDVVIEDIDLSSPLTYHSMYKPEEFAIDTFYAEMVTPAIEQDINVALGKSVTVSDQLNDGYGGANAVDGVISTASRWVNAKVAGLHWLEVDLGQAYAINRIVVRDDTPSANFTLQAEVDGVWQDLKTETNNTNKVYELNFDEINATKVRYNVTTEGDALVRLFELEVYATVKYQ